jgi:hypothetical protein
LVFVIVDCFSASGRHAPRPNLLPRADNAGRRFPQEDFDRVKQELASRFEGVTAYVQAPAEGMWRQGAESDSTKLLSSR